MSLNEEIASEIQRLDPSSIIELFELDATELGGDIFRFHNGTNKLNQNLVWQGNEYIRFPIQVTGFETSGQGQFPRPAVSVSNVLSAITTILLQYKDLIGSKFTRKRTLLKFLDAVNFPDGINPTADPDAQMVDDVYWVDRKASEDREQVQFELASAADLQNVQLPNRTVNKNTCPWIYRGPECGYTGVPQWDQNDQVIPLPPASELANEMMAARGAMFDAENYLAVTQVALQIAGQNWILAQVYTLETHFNLIGPSRYYCRLSPLTGWTAVWANGGVGLGSTYQCGPFVQFETNSDYFQVSLFEITGYDRDEHAVNVTFALYTEAITTRDNAAAALATATAAFNVALAALPLDDQMYKQDICGKRLTSCQLRFGQAGPLPFGGFPGVAR